MKIIIWKGTGEGKSPAKLTVKNKMKEIVKQYDKITIFAQPKTWKHIPTHNLIIGQNNQN